MASSSTFRSGSTVRCIGAMYRRRYIAPIYRCEYTHGARPGRCRRSATPSGSSAPDRGFEDRPDACATPVHCPPCAGTPTTRSPGGPSSGTSDAGARHPPRRLRRPPRAAPGGPQRRRAGRRRLPGLRPGDRPLRLLRLRRRARARPTAAASRTRASSSSSTRRTTSSPATSSRSAPTAAGTTSRRRELHGRRHGRRAHRRALEPRVASAHASAPSAAADARAVPGGRVAQRSRPEYASRLPPGAVCALDGGGTRDGRVESRLSVHSARPTSPRARARGTPARDGHGVRRAVGARRRRRGRRHDPRRRLARDGRARLRRHAAGHDRRHGAPHRRGRAHQAATRSSSATCPWLSYHVSRDETVRNAAALDPRRRRRGEARRRSQAARRGRARSSTPRSR